MRLVDKDEIMKFPIRLDHYDEINGRRQFVLGIEAVLEYIHEMPTVEAIPIEWMYKWRMKHNEQYNVGVSSFSQMISDWEKENGNI